MSSCLSFVLAPAPWVFTKVLKPVVGFLRSMGVRCVIYIDDLLLMHQDLRGHTVLALGLWKCWVS